MEEWLPQADWVAFTGLNESFIPKNFQDTEYNRPLFWFPSA
jgi:hypothetical protein